MTEALALAFALAVPTAAATQPLEQSIEEIYAVGADATLSVRNTDGAIRIYGADSPEIRLHAIKKAYSQERLNGIVVDVKATANSVVIDTIYPPKKSIWSFSDRSGTVDYTLVVPQSATVAKLDLVNGELVIEGLRDGSASARLESGRMSVHNCFSSLDLAVTNGGLDLFYDWWESKLFSINAATLNAGIRTNLPADASFQVDAKSETGTITNAFGRGKSKPAPVSHTKLTASFGSEAGATLKLRSTVGNIKIEEGF